MKKDYILVLIVCLCVMMTGCFSVKKEQQKTSFRLNEEARIDSFQIAMIGFRAVDPRELNMQVEKDLLIQYTFRIQNLGDEEIEIEADRFFKLKNENCKSIGTYKKTTVKAKEIITYDVVYDVSRANQYSILFYSGIVGNNIEFIGEL